MPAISPPGYSNCWERGWHPLRRRHSPPGAGTLRRVLLAVDADALDHVIGQWLRAHAACDGDGWAVALDGKDLHGAWNDEGRLVLLSALMHRSGKRGAVTLAHVQVPADTTEVTQVKAVLEGVDTARALVTADAAHTCATTARHRRFAAGGELTNQGRHETFFAAPSPPLLEWIRKGDPVLLSEELVCPGYTGGN
ncbi:hypothetical protein OG320_08955 [Microbispora sp. NBC_01189]|uniref:hypothetical protein n=1 Tax=Microbispora sp. NBC_01189 TaxID=2903583 RepID=UPI002E1287E2|nr:hypothetical protein OG320_08955 [Microbispora sp. NBC_01189]